MAEKFTHTFNTSLPIEQLRKILSVVCHAPFSLALQGDDFTFAPHHAVIEVTTASIEDRDRARIAIRDAEKQIGHIGSGPEMAHTPTVLRSKH